MTVVMQKVLLVAPETDYIAGEEENLLYGDDKQETSKEDLQLSSNQDTSKQ